MTQSQEIMAFLLQSLKLVSDLGQRAVFLCALVFCDTLKKKGGGGQKRDCISNTGTVSKDETLRAKFGCDTTRKPCHQLLVAGIVPMLRDGEVRADHESWTRQGSPALHQAHRSLNRSPNRGPAMGNSPWDRSPPNSFSKGTNTCKAGRSQEQSLHSSSTPIRAKATPTMWSCPTIWRSWQLPRSKDPCALTPRLPHHETCLLPRHFHNLPHLEQFCRGRSPLSQGAS